MNAFERAKQYWWVFAGLIVLIIVIVFFTSCKPGDIPGTKSEWHTEVTKSLNQLGIPDTHSNFKHKYTTPRGAIIESVATVSPEALSAIDRGLQRRIDRFKDPRMFPQWPAATQVAGTKILFVEPNQSYTTSSPDSGTGPCVLESIPGAPCIYVKGIKTAGTVLGTNDRWDAIDVDPPLVLPHQAAGSWQWLDYLEAAAHNEDEHRASWLNVRNEPTGQFYLHLGVNDWHPWPWFDGSGAKGLVAPVPSNCGVE